MAQQQRLTDVQGWSSPEWRARAVEWMDGHLAAAGLERTGEVTQPHLRAWATTLHAPTTGGDVWLKAAAYATRFEPRVYPELRKAAPGLVLEPIAVDRARWWVLLPDGGEPLGDRGSPEEVAAVLEHVLPAYGQLQRTLARRTQHLIHEQMPVLWGDAQAVNLPLLLSLLGPGVRHRADPAETAAYEMAQAQQPAVEMWLARLAASAARVSVDHNDLHPWNVLVPRGAGAADLAGNARVYDWGDAMIGHPFASMLVPLRWAADTFGEGPDGVHVRRLRDAYLSAFTDLASHAELVGDLEAACRLGMIGRADAWNRVVRMSEQELEGELAGRPVAWLAKLADSSYLGDDVCPS